MKFFYDFILKYKLLRYNSTISKQLDFLEQKVNGLESYTKEVKNSTTIIPSDYLQNIKKVDTPILEYVNSSNLYSFNTQLSKVFFKVSHKKLDALNARYRTLCNKYLFQIADLEKEIEKVNKELRLYYDNIASFEKEIINIRKRYIAHSEYVDIKQKYQSTNTFFENKPSEKSNKFINLYAQLQTLIEEWNKEFVAQELQHYKTFFSNIDDKSLDDQQRRAVITDEDNNLVVAGAGSGKTLTISGKVKYLVETKGVKPEEILLISFTKKAAKEMSERIKDRLKIDIDVKTFHKLGLDIISRATKNKPDIAENPNKYIQAFFNNEMYDNPILLKKIIEFFGYYLNVPKDLESFNNLAECYDYHKSMDLETLKSKYEQQAYIDKNSQEFKQQKITLAGEKVKSLEEVMIANFLFLNGIEYEYEKEYGYSISVDSYRKYKPDFFLPKYHIYIEHFGITRSGRTPWLSEIEERKYIEGMHWKRNLHDDTGTTLIETYSYLASEGTLLDTLRTKLLDKNVQFREVDFIDIFNTIHESEKFKQFEEFVNFVSTFINLFKSNGFQVEKFEELIQSLDKQHIFFYNRTKIFLEITKEVFVFYEESLRKEKLIDFNDMINNATAIVRSGNMNFNYKYIIIDEFQDASVSRFQLITEIRNITNAKIMCVGDDWQSIYRFTGADLNLFSDFEKHFGYSQLLKIENTYRNSQQLINIASNFVMQNPKQIKKSLQSTKERLNPIKVYSYTNKKSLIDSLMMIIEEIVEMDGPETEIMLLGRNNFDINVLKDDDVTDFKVTQFKDSNKIIYSRYPKLNIFFLTTHKSKGLEADYVILLNAVNSLVGFPNKIADDPILSLVLTEGDQHLYAEERRLFYVALTRTKNDTFILTSDARMSVFVKELTDKHGIKPKSIAGITTTFENPKCPKCIEGRLNIRENSSNQKKFLGCSNFPLCDYTINDIKTVEEPIVCPLCKGYMLLRRGPRGEFYGCSNYKKDEKIKCTYTIELSEADRLKQNIVAPKY